VVPVVLGASIIAFTIMHVAPGSPWNREGRALDPAVIARLNEELGLDQPLPMQYLAWLGHMLRGDFGISTSTFQGDVNDMIIYSIGPTLLLCGLAFGVAVLIGVPLGLLAALRHGRPLGHVATGLSLVGMAAPAFALAALLQLVVAAPRYGQGGMFGLAPSLFPHDGLESPMSLVLPTLALAALPMAQIARHTKASVLEVIHSDYVRTAHAKGLYEDQVVRNHLLRNAAIPLLTISGTILALLITGSIVVERVFEIPGLGNLYFWSIRGRDYTTLMGITVIYALVVALVNAVVDITYGIVDPRVRDGYITTAQEASRG
jgi:oligopeptide transport system permease protein